MESDSISGGILVLLLILFLAIFGGNLLRQRGIDYIQDAGLSTILGMLFGFILEILGETPQIKSITALNSEFVLFVLLPPIIFQSGYNIDKQKFFGNFGLIITYAFIGFFISTFLISWGIFLICYFHIVSFQFTLIESFIFGLIISSTDPISVLPVMKKMNLDNTLYNIILGEGLLNGPISLSLYRTILETSKNDSNFFEVILWFLLIFCVSFSIGSLCAFIISYILKNVSGVYNQINVEATAVIFGPWISYLISEGLGLNGSVSILFCGIFMARYTTPNLSPMTKTMIKKGYSVISDAAQNLVFIFLGMGLFSFNLPYYKIEIIDLVCVLSFILFARASNVIGCSWVLQALGYQISISFQILMWTTGLKGIISFALATRAVRELPNGDLMISFTIIFSIVGLLTVGVLLRPFIEKLEVQSKDNESKVQINHIRDIIESFENKYLYRYFVNTEHEQDSEVEQIDIDS